jgi:UDP-N-acetylmuramoyl-tripeptide--D-alanyl-D-alanine ligase
VKKIAKAIVVKKLNYQLKKLQNKNDFKTIGVVGSIGKTSTKLAIARVLSQNYNVQYQDGNYNDTVTVPLIFFGEDLPSLFNPIAWLALFRRNAKQLKKPYPYDFVVVELGSDGPGQISEFKDCLQLDIAVVTAVTPEHMQNFADLDDVAKEELAVSDFSGLLMVNKDLIDETYLKDRSNLLTYAINKPANFTLKHVGGKTSVAANNENLFTEATGSASIPELYSILAASAVATRLGMKPADIQQGLKKIKAVPGRMQRLAGVNGATIIDDSYNASPEAAKLALDTLYADKSDHKIALLGNMNEMGHQSQAVHEEVGNYCDPKQLDLVVTLGPDANKYLAKTAAAKGCKVEKFDSPYEAGEYLKPLLTKNTTILIKGSQNKVFAEEAIKSLLANPDDEAKLVRQSKAWLEIKQKAFSR